MRAELLLIGGTLDIPGVASAPYSTVLFLQDSKRKILVDPGSFVTHQFLEEKLKERGEIIWKGKRIRIEDVGYIKKGLKVVYSGDTRPCENIVKISKDADLLIHDGTFLEEDLGEKAHADVKEAAKLAKKAKVKLLVLTHISRRYTDTKELEEEAKKVFPNSKVAYDFMKIRLKS